MSLNAARLKHQIKIFGGNVLGRYLSEQYSRGRGPAGRLISAFSHDAQEIGVKADVQFTTTPERSPAPHYSLNDEADGQYLKLLCREDAPTFKAAILSAQDVDVSFPTGMHQVAGRVLIEAMPVPYLLTNPKYYYGLESMRLKRKRQMDEAVLVAMPFHHNFYHWMIDILPRLTLVDRAPHLQHLPLIVPKSAPGFVAESLKLAGYQSKTVFLDDGVYRFKTLHMLSLLSPMLEVSADAVSWLNTTFSKSSSQTTPKRIYVSRRDAKIRFVSNEAELAEQLAASGFETVLMSDYSLADQINLFRNADYIIGPHGAGFVHLAFSKPGTTFIEFFSRAHHSPSYNRLSSIRRLKYGFLVGEPTAMGGFSVNPDALRKLLSQALH
jgi:Glycosyltransferase 61